LQRFRRRDALKQAIERMINRTFYMDVVAPRARAKKANFDNTRHDSGTHFPNQRRAPSLSPPRPPIER
jgi:hypothetical protein